MRRQDILSRVTEAQRDFAYAKVVDEGDYKVYRCHKPGTRVYAFEIIVGKYGIYLNGDINCLVWDVARDINFLAGGDVDYYIHSKLAAPFIDQQEIDPDKRDEWLVKEMVRWLDRNPDSLNTELLEHDSRSVEGGSPWSMEYDCQLPPLNIIADFFVQHGLDSFLKNCEVWALYDSVHDSDDMHHVLREGYEYDPDFPMDNDITRHSWSVMFCVYMACYAARKIVEAGIA